jgi:uncharacterized protein (DUF1800 family)
MQISPFPSQPWREPLRERQKIQHVLNRITFGARQGDLERAGQVGLNQLLEQQLNPGTLEDSLLEAKLQDLQTLEMSPAELAADFPPPMQVKRRQEKQLALVERWRGARAMEAPATQAGAQDSAMSPHAPRDQANAEDMPADTLRNSVPQPQGPREILIQLGQEELLRAVYSQRQLQEVMVRFWMNHFNVYWPKGADRYYLTSFEQNVIRPRALGNFEELLVATAQSPAMLFYLDNWMSVSPDQRNQARPLHPRFSPAMMGPARTASLGAGRPPQIRKQNRRGLNENYGRELMELHTIGLHYLQKDVTEVARCFTGWTILRPGRGGGFYFNPRMHDYGEKVVLGHTIPAGQGIEDGLNVLHILAISPYTARHISHELCQRFVTDDPPADLIDRATHTYLQTRGDIRSVLRTILSSPEFYSQAAYEAKVKSPFEYVASALRALGAQTEGGKPLPGFMAQMGEPMFLYEAPSGYDDVATTWINSSALLARMNFAIALCLGRIPGTSVDWQTLASPEAGETPREILIQLAPALTGSSLSPATENIILSRLSDGKAGRLLAGREMRMMAALLIASPEFQKR